VLGGDASPVVGLQLDRLDEPDLAMKAPVVEPVDVLSNSDLDVADTLPSALGSHHWVADALGLEQRVERPGHRVVVAVPAASHRRDGLGFCQNTSRMNAT